MMDCMDSMAPSEEELLGFVLDGIPLSREAKHHLERCSICQRLYSKYKQTNDYLLSKLYRSQCPEPEQLHLYCAVLLSPDETIDVANHLRECPLCTQEVADIRRAFVDTEPLPEDNESALTRAARRIVASLVPWKPQLVTRSDTPATNWPRQYRAETLDLSLHLSRSSNGEIMLLGLCTSIDPDESVEAFEGKSVELYYAADAPRGEPAKHVPLMSTTVDDLGNIVFKAVPVGEYVMIVGLQEAEIVIEGLVIENG